jgi:hypothetical protein
MIKKWIADFLDSICAESYEPKDFYIRVIDGLPYVVPFRKRSK